MSRTGDVGGFAELFSALDELEHRAEAVFHLERLPELADRSRAEYAGVTLASRLMASVGAPVALEVTGVGLVDGSLARVASDWCAVRGPGQDWAIRLDAVTTVRGASERSVPEVAWSRLAGLGFVSALRGLADGGAPCVLRLRDGAAHEVVLHRVGADFVEAGAGAGRILFAYAAVAAVQSPERSEEPGLS